MNIKRDTVHFYQNSLFKFVTVVIFTKPAFTTLFEILPLRAL